MNTELRNKRLSKNMQIAVERILEAYLPNKPIAILLCGGYGRGEGAWYDDMYGNPQPYNDYDFAVIANRKLSNDVYRKLRMKIADEVGIQWVDIAFYKPNYFNHMKNTIKNIDLLYASTLLYGNNMIYKNIRLNSNKIGQKDIVKLYRTRIWTLLGSWKGEFRDLDIEEARFFKNQIAKSILAACDIILIHLGQYDSSYKKRVEIINEVEKEKELLCCMSKWAINEKLNPSSTKLNKKEMEDLYWKGKKIFEDALKIGTGRKWNQARNPKRVKCYVLTNSDYLLHFAYELLIKRLSISKKDLDIFIAQCYVFWAYDRHKINNHYLDKASNILVKWKYIELDNHKKNHDWNYLREEVAKARNNI